MNLLLIGCGAYQVPVIDEAHKLGAKVFALDGDKDAIGLKNADYSEVCDIKNLGEIEEVAIRLNSKFNISGCMTLGVECPESVGFINDLLGLQGVGRYQAIEMVNKISRYENLNDYGIRTPKYQVSAKYIKENWNIYPCVVKPMEGSAAAGVKYIENKFQLQDEEFDIVEEYIEGHELSTESIVLTQQLYMTYINDRNYEKKFKYKPYMIEDGFQMPSTIDQMIRAKVHTTIGKIIKCFQLEKCILKCDLIVKDNIVYVIECTPRLSGGKWCSHVITPSTGVEIVNIAVRMALGLPVYPKELIPTKNTAYAQRYVFSDRPIKSHRDRGISFECTGKTIKEAIENAQKKVNDELQQSLRTMQKAT